jgi:UDP-N-acetylmuramate dehydrogenase
MEYCQREYLAGLEFLAGIPGTVGGAVAMNAGAFGQETGSRLRYVELLMPGGEPATWDPSRLNLGYRKASLPEGSVIVFAGFELQYEKREVIFSRIASYLKDRKEKQPLDCPSGGSIFKNPPRDYAGRLVEIAGLKGKKIGGAMISTRHANWIVNTGEARASDVLALMDLARQVVKDKTGIELEPEIRVVGQQEP